MTWLQASVIGNIILGIIIAMLLMQGKAQRQQCELRHNPIDEAIMEMKRDIRRIWDYLNEKLT